MSATVHSASSAAVADPAHGTPARRASDRTDVREFLTFTLGGEDYGLDILKVQEIRGYDAVTRIPDAPDYMKGMINLRGTVVPVVDLRMKFRLGAVDYDDTTVMVVLNVGGRVVGMVVDAVSDVVAFTPEQIRPTPELGASVDTRYLVGLGTVNEQMVLLIDIEKLMIGCELMPELLEL